MTFDHAGHIVLSNSPPDHGIRPSVTHLFRSAVKIFQDRAVGVLLAGMGRDGEALRLGAVQYILPPEEIALKLANLIKGAKSG
jgi:chemotaxis response regulator CheB